jgi:two-component system response regulator ChvI
MERFPASRLMSHP